MTVDVLPSGTIDDPRPTPSSAPFWFLADDDDDDDDVQLKSADCSTTVSIYSTRLSSQRINEYSVMDTAARFMVTVKVSCWTGLMLAAYGHLLLRLSHTRALLLVSKPRLQDIVRRQAVSLRNLGLLL